MNNTGFVRDVREVSGLFSFFLHFIEISHEYFSIVDYQYDMPCTGDRIL
jgi:hypothetical protein